MKKILFLTVVLLVVVGGYIALDKKQVIEKQKNIQLSTTIGLYNGEASALALLAFDRDYFKDENLEVTIKYYPTGKHAMQAMLDHEVDFANATDFVAIKNSFINPHFKILASMAEANINGMLAFKTHGIQKPEDIKGKRVGTTIGTATEYYTGVFLNQNHLDLTDITLVNVPFSKRVQVIEEGSVDALFAWEPYIYQLMHKYPNDLSYFSMPLGFEFYFLFMVDEEFHQKNPEVAKRILRALHRAQKDIEAQPQQFEQYLAGVLNLESDYAKYTLKKHTFELSFPYSLTVALQNQANWLLSNKLVENKQVEQAQIFDTSVLKEIEPISVTVLE